MPLSIKTQIDFLTDEFNRVFPDELWKKYPATTINELDNNVSNRDGFIARLIGLIATFDTLNKSVFDKRIQIKSEGGRLALVNYLKVHLPGYDLDIDNTFITLNMIGLLRTQFAHSSNASYKNAIDFFGITEPLDDYAVAWELIQRKFQVFLQELTGLVAKKNAPLLKQLQLQQQAIETAFLFTIKKHKRYLQNNPIAKILLREIAIQGQVVDTVLAENILQPTKVVRQLLMPFTGSFLRVSYHSHSATLITMDRFREELKNIDDWLNQ